MSNKDIAPHKGEELNYVMLGLKPLASIEYSKQPDMFARALALKHVVNVRVHSNTHVTVTLEENKHLHDTFALLTSAKAAQIVRSKEEKQRLLGRLFGYSEKQIDDFIKLNIQCNCVCCDFQG